MMYTLGNFLSRRFKTQQSVHSLCVCLSLHTQLHGFATDVTGDVLWGFFKAVHNLELF